jgi:hypothetical protein
MVAVVQSMLCCSLLVRWLNNRGRPDRHLLCGVQQAMVAMEYTRQSLVGRGLGGMII